MDTIKHERTAKNKIAHPQQHIIIFVQLNTKCNKMYLYIVIEFIILLLLLLLLWE